MPRPLSPRLMTSPQAILAVAVRAVYPTRMQDEVRALLILQDRDRRLLALAKDLEKLPQDEARAKAKLAGDEAAVTKAHQALLDCELRVKKIELDAETRRTTIKRLKLQQFETRKNEEFVALGHEITRYEKDLDEFETRELEAMEEVDGFRKAHKAAEAARTVTRKLVEEDLATDRPTPRPHGGGTGGSHRRAGKTARQCARKRAAALQPPDENKGRPRGRPAARRQMRGLPHEAHRLHGDEGADRQGNRPVRGLRADPLQSRSESFS